MVLTGDPDDEGKRAANPWRKTEPPTAGHDHRRVLAEEGP